MKWKYFGQSIWKIMLLSIGSLISLQCLCAFAEEENYLKHPKRTEWQAGGFYEGTFEDGTAFQMNLPYPPPKSINHANWEPSVTASYWYPRRFSGETISLKIKSFEDNAFSIAVQKIDNKGNTADEEIFEGILSLDKTSAHGQWTLIKKKRKMTFAMKRRFEYKGVDVSLPSREEKEHDSERSIAFSAIFPVLGNSKVDGWIKDFISKCDYDSECINSVEVAWFSKNSYSLYGNIWGYGDGMPHGNGYSTYRHYVTTGAVPKLAKLNHFISTSDGCLESISKKIISALKTQEYSRAEAGKLRDVEHVKFLPTPHGILFDFDPYEVGAYSEGAPRVFIERQKVGGCIKYLPQND